MTPGFTGRHQCAHFVTPWTPCPRPREHGRHFWHPWSRSVKTSSVYRALIWFQIYYFLVRNVRCVTDFSRYYSVNLDTNCITSFMCVICIDFLFCFIVSPYLFTWPAGWICFPSSNVFNKCVYRGFVLFLLWSPYVIGQTIIFLPCDLYLSFFFFFPRLISAVGDWISTILPHMVWP